MKSGQKAGRGTVAGRIAMGLALTGFVTFWAARTLAAPVISTAPYAPGEPDPDLRRRRHRQHVLRGRPTGIFGSPDCAVGRENHRRRKYSRHGCEHELGSHAI